MRQFITSPVSVVPFLLVADCRRTFLFSFFDFCYTVHDRRHEPRLSVSTAQNGFSYGWFSQVTNAHGIVITKLSVVSCRSSTFRPLAFNVNFPPGRLRKWFLTHPPSPSLVSLRRSLFGPSFIYVPVPSLFTVIMEEVLHPFYIFQILAVALWIWDDYIQYAIAIMLITATSTLVECTQTR